MDPNSMLDFLSGLDPTVMAALAVLAGLLHYSKVPNKIGLPLLVLLGGVWGYLVTLDTVDAALGSYSKYFSAILVNSMGGVVVGRIAAPFLVEKVFNIDTKDKPPT